MRALQEMPAMRTRRLYEPVQGKHTYVPLDQNYIERLVSASRMPIPYSRDECGHRKTLPLPTPMLFATSTKSVIISCSIVMRA